MAFHHKLFGKRPGEKPVFTCALYNMEGENLGETIVREDVPGLTTFLMVQQKGGIVNA